MIEMLMEIYLSEEKAKKNNIDINACYQKINRYFLDRGVKIKAPGVYQGIKNDFGTFVTAQMQLPDSYFGDTPDSPEYREDALKSYYEVEAMV